MATAPPIQLSPRQRTALPGSRYDRLVDMLKWLLPSATGLVIATVLMWPLFFAGRDLSFVVSKDEVAIARERLRVSEAVYRGEDSKGQPFSIRAGSAVQQSSRDPVVKLRSLSAELTMPDGLATVTAPSGSYDMATETVAVDGPLNLRSTDGYALTTGDVIVDLPNRRVASDSPISGRLPLGSFDAGNLNADIAERRVVLGNRARLHIVQRRVRGSAQ